MGTASMKKAACRRNLAPAVPRPSRGRPPAPPVLGPPLSSKPASRAHHHTPTTPLLTTPHKPHNPASTTTAAIAQVSVPDCLQRRCRPAPVAASVGLRRGPANDDSPAATGLASPNHGSGAPFVFGRRGERRFFKHPTVAPTARCARTRTPHPHPEFRNAHSTRTAEPASRHPHLVPPRMAPRAHRRHVRAAEGGRLQRRSRPPPPP
jgi:hypothetical protein